MPIHYKTGGAWKDVDTVYCKVSGSWKIVPAAFVKVNGVWRKFHDQTNYIPSGAIVPFYGTGTAPTDWIDYLTSTSLIKGWDGTAGDIGATGGSRGFSWTSVTSGNHTGTTLSALKTYTSGSSSSYSYGSRYAAGNHSHTMTAAAGSYPRMLRARLIQAANSVGSLPAGAMCWAADALSGLTEVAGVDRFLSMQNNADLLEPNLSNSVSTNTVANHRHHALGSSYIGQESNPYYNNNAGSHSHSFTVNDITWDMLRVCVRLFYDLSNAIDPVEDMILGWPANIAPAGYNLCDGNNGTIDLRNRFIVSDPAATPGTLRGTGNITGTYNVSGGSHNHQGGIVYNQETVSSYHSGNVSHSHAGSIAVAQDYANVRLAFIQKAA